MMFYYDTCCVESDYDSINAMRDAAESITYPEFAASVEGLDAWAESKGYDLDPDEGLTLADDWHVAYYRSTYKGDDCLYLVWSGVEYIWTESGAAEGFGYGSRFDW